MNTDEQMNELLNEMATTSTPSPDPAFVEHLDARLRVAHAGGAMEPGPQIRWLPAFAVAAILIVGLAGTFALRSGDSTEVVMTVASDTSVYLDGEPIPGTAGLVLPDGTRIVVGPAGEAVVDGVVLAPGSEALVVDAQVTLVVTGGEQVPTDIDRSTIIVQSDERANPPPSSTSTRPTTTTSTASTASGPESSGSSPRSTTVSSDTVTDRTSQDGGTTGTTGSTPDETRSTQSRPASTSTTAARSTRPSTTTPATTVPADQQLVLTATEIGDDRLRLDWVIGRDLAPAGWRIRVRQGDREATILVIRGGDARSATLERSASAGRSIWVEAVDRSGRRIAASDPIAIR